MKSLSDRKKKHNHTYMLHFTFGALDNGQRKMTVKSAKLMFHVTSAEVKPHPKKEVKFSLYRLTHPRQPNSAEKIQEYSYDIPSRGSGIWQEINMTDMVKDWHLSPDNNHGMILEFKRDWMKNYVAVENGKQVSITICMVSQYLKNFLFIVSLFGSKSKAHW